MTHFTAFRIKLIILGIVAVGIVLFGGLHIIQLTL